MRIKVRVLEEYELEFDTKEKWSSKIIKEAETLWKNLSREKRTHLGTKIEVADFYEVKTR